MRVEIRSRAGNAVIGILGVSYAVAAVVLLVVHFVQTLGAASLTDRAIQVLLLMVLAVSLWFVSIAARGLGLRMAQRGTV
ncbi:MAG TPA: hypothetical protein VNA04_01950 [Thermoanaerobaculia bacterium]|nr:hypothetical protein [Thermoanaerobaculia bacterium]